MDKIIKQIITLGLPTLAFFWASYRRGAGNDRVWSALHRLGGPFNMTGGLVALVLIGLLASYLAYFLVDGLLIKFYKTRRNSEPLENLLREINQLPFSEDLKIKLTWILEHNQPSKSLNLKYQINRWFTGTVIFITICSFTGYIGWLHKFLELTSHFKLQYLILACCCLFFFILARKRKLWIALSLLCIFLNLAEVAPWYLAPARAAETMGKPLRILQSNVLTNNRRYADVISLVREENPDIAVFVEVSAIWAEELKALKDLLPYSFSNQDTLIYGTAIYSKLPLENTHLYDFSGRKILSADVKFSETVLSLIAAHPSVPTRAKNYISRNNQLRGIGETVANLKNPVAVVGDLNVTMWSPFYQQMIATSGLKNSRSGFGLLPTWPTKLPMFYLPIDHCLVSPEIQVLKSRTGPYLGSDHLPMITDLAIAPTPVPRRS